MGKADVVKMIAGTKCEVKDGWTLDKPEMAKIDNDTYGSRIARWVETELIPSVAPPSGPGEPVNEERLLFAGLSGLHDTAQPDGPAPSAPSTDGCRSTRDIAVLQRYLVARVSRKTRTCMSKRSIGVVLIILSSMAPALRGQEAAVMMVVVPRDATAGQRP